MQEELIKQLQETKYIVGLTGGIGSGKTTVGNLFAAKGVDTVDADIVAREVVAPNSSGLQAIEQRFGPQILLENGELNRHALRELVFSDTAAKNDLNAILHPLIRLEMLNQLANTQSDYCLLIAPLLYENQLESLCNKSIAVDLSEQQQLSRAMARDDSKESTIQGIMAAQISRSERLKKADYIVDNSQSLDALPEQVNDLHKKLMTKSNLHLK